MKNEKIFAFVVEAFNEKQVTCREVQDRFECRSSIDTVVSGSMKDAIRIFNMRHTVRAWGKEKPKYEVINEYIE